MKKRFHGVVLVGMMGSGKTTISRHLASIMKLECIDTDQEIERSSGRRISDIFEIYGEDYFRNLESQVIAKIVNDVMRDNREIVLSIGGGAFSASNIPVLKSAFYSVFLNAPPHILAMRLKNDFTRPLLAGTDIAATVMRLINARYKFYSKADMIINIVGHEGRGVISKKILRSYESKK